LLQAPGAWFGPTRRPARPRCNRRQLTSELAGAQGEAERLRSQLQTLRIQMNTAEGRLSHERGGRLKVEAAQQALQLQLEQQLAELQALAGSRQALEGLRAQLAAQALELEQQQASAQQQSEAGEALAGRLAAAVSELEQLRSRWGLRGLRLQAQACCYCCRPAAPWPGQSAPPPPLLFTLHAMGAHALGHGRAA
jgi:chromosome segregation ATPase